MVLEAAHTRASRTTRHGETDAEKEWCWKTRQIDLETATTKEWCWKTARTMRTPDETATTQGNDVGSPLRLGPLETAATKEWCWKRSVRNAAQGLEHGNGVGRRSHRARARPTGREEGMVLGE